MRSALGILLFMVVISASAQVHDIDIAVHKPAEISLLPGITTIFNDTVYIFVIRGMKKGMIAKASMPNTKVLEIMDSLLFIRTDFKAPSGKVLVTNKSTLTLTVTDEFNKKVTTIERVFDVATLPVRQPFRNIRIPAARSISISLSRTTVTTIFNSISISTRGYLLGNTLNARIERLLRRHMNFDFTYTGANGLDNRYRSVELNLAVNGKNAGYRTDGAKLSAEMRKMLIRQNGRQDYTLILHRAYIQGEKPPRDVTDTIRYLTDKK